MSKVWIKARRSFNDDGGSVRRGDIVERTQAQADRQIKRGFAEAATDPNPPAASQKGEKQDGEKAKA